MDEDRILVVEDEVVVAMDLQNTLKQLGYLVPATVPSGEAAIERTAEVKPDLVLMDIVLKGDLDGVEAAEEIHTRFDVPVVYLTAYADDETIRRAKATGPYGYVLKPFDRKQLSIQIEIALERHQMEKKGRREKSVRELRIRELQDALGKVKTLRGLLPICANCKSIRDGEGRWHSLESYLSKHTEAMLSHGVCPDCRRNLYPWFIPDEE